MDEIQSNGDDSSESSIPSKSSKHLDNLALNTHKAGMQGLDASKINEIIQNASEGSKYYLHKRKAQEKLDAKISEMLATAKSFSPHQLEAAAEQMRRGAEECASHRDLSRTIVHVDMDMFYAAVEMRDNPKLSSVPMAVGGESMLSTSNYLARKFGVRAAMPGFIARKLCPELVIVPCNFPKYRAASEEVQEVFARYDPNFVMMSLDEAYLDITRHLQENGTGYELREEETLAQAVVTLMRSQIQQKTKLTASAGIAPNTRLAKVCSDLKKPNGQYYLPPDCQAIMEFIAQLPIRKIGGIGNVMEQQLRALGIVCCGDIAPRYGLLKLLFKDTSHHYFLRISLGLGETDLSQLASGERKSISTETTFAATENTEEMLRIIHDLCCDLERDMKKRGLLGKLVTLKTKNSFFDLKTRSEALSEPTNEATVMEGVARKILHQQTREGKLCLRLLGVRMSNFSDSASKQRTLNSMYGKKRKESGPSLVCPVCGKQLESSSLGAVNRHIDNCLQNGDVEEYSDRGMRENKLPDGNEASSTFPDGGESSSTFPGEGESSSTFPDGGESSSTFSDREESSSTFPDREESSSTFPDREESSSALPNNVETRIALSNKGEYSSVSFDEHDRFSAMNTPLKTIDGNDLNCSSNDDVEHNVNYSSVCKYKKKDVEESNNSDKYEKMVADYAALNSINCPFCNESNLPFVAALNKHLDVCLADKQHSSKPLQPNAKRKTTSIASQSKKAKPNPSITKYFSRLPSS